MAATVELYTTNYCPYCVRAKMLLEKKGVAYTEIDVSDDDNARAELVKKSGGRRTVPQIFIGGEGIGGCDDLYALDAAGKLDSLLQG